MASREKSYTKVAVNRKALHDYFVVERFEAGIALLGTEVKSIRNGNISLVGGFARLEDGDVLLYNLNIPPYKHGNRFNHDPARPRRLLLHGGQIGRLRVQIEQKGHTLVPLSVYIKKGWIKVELALCKGKRLSDKRETLRRRQSDQETARAIARARG